MISPASVGSRTNEPDPEGVRQAFARIGYKLEEAIADLIDNSIDARAANVLIRIFRAEEELRRVVLADDGDGIASARIDECMQFGARIHHDTTDRGKYGIGLKAASFSQARSLSVLSRRDREAVGRRWTVDSIREGWLCEVLDADQSTRLLDSDWGPVDLSCHGTIVLWDDIDHIRPGRGGIDATLNRIFRNLPMHLGMVFHRFLQDRRLRIVMDSVDVVTGSQGPAYEVHPLDPFQYKRSGHAGYPRDLAIRIEDTILDLRCHIWPPKATEPEYKLGGKVAQRQGFYFYRNDRLIQAGGWNGWRDEDSEPHLSLARVEVDLPAALDGAFGLNVQKSGVDAGMGFKRILDSARDGGWGLKDYIRDADAVYRNTEPAPKDGPLIPGSGLPVALRRYAERHMANGKAPARSVAISWYRLPPEEFFRIDREARRLILNREYRYQVSGVDDSALVKLLMFLVLRDEFDRERLRTSHIEWLETLNHMLVMTVRQE